MKHSTTMNRREALTLFGAGAIGLTMMGSQSKSEAMPNVILVMTDDQGYGDLSCHGNPWLKTPHLDRLHGESLRLTNFHVSPTCSPTRASVMTGRYNNATGVWHTIMGRSLLRRDEVTLADLFKASGYSTGIFGKWHLGDNYPFRPQDRGFDEVLIHGGGGIGQAPDYWGNDYFDDTYFHNGTPTPYKGYCADVFFEEALNFIQQHRDEPFFCYLPTNTAHGPWLAKEEDTAVYRDNPDVASPEFYGMLKNIDDNMGTLMERLEAWGLADNAILVFMTDNGSCAGGKRTAKHYNAGLRGLKGSPYDGGHRVPCFIRYPEASHPAHDIPQLTAHIDLMPTLLGMCGITPPDSLTFDGMDLTGLFSGVAGDWAGRTLIVDSQRIDHPKPWRQSAVMTDQGGEYRLVNRKELYDMQADPGQKHNVHAQHPEVVQRLEQAYEDWWEITATRFGDYCRIVIGAPDENPCRLNAHDWHGEKVPWNQPHILQGLAANGVWYIDVAQSGSYRFELCRWPKEAGTAIPEAVPGGQALPITSAHIRLDRVDATLPVPEGAKSVTFEVELEAGPNRLQTWFTGPDIEERGAYYVYVTAL